METIVFIGSNKSGTSRDALITSSNMGFYTVLFTDRKKFVKQREEFTEVDQIIFLNDLLDKEKVLNGINELRNMGYNIRACISFIDPFVSYTAKLSEELGLSPLSSEALKNIEDKICIRELIKDESYSPYFTIFQFDEPIKTFANRLEQQLPLILKSPSSNGSKDVLLAKTKDEFIKGIKVLIKKYPAMPVLIEEYLQGPQYLIEVMVYNDSINIVAVIKQEILNKDRFIIIGYLTPASLSNELTVQLEHVITNIIQQLGLSNGNCHFEMRNVAGVWKLIEINPRMSGGAMNRLIMEGTGINYVKEIIKLNMGEEPALIPSKSPFVYAHFITINSRGRLIKVTGKHRASIQKGVKEVFVKPRKGTILREPHSLGDRYAYVIATGDTAVQARKNALNAAKEIKFYLDPL